MLDSCGAIGSSRSLFRTLHAGECGRYARARGRDPATRNCAGPATESAAPTAGRAPGRFRVVGKPSVARSSCNQPDWAWCGSTLTATSTESPPVAGLAVSDQVVIVRTVKLQAPVALQRCVLASNAIHECNEVAQAGRVLPIPMTNLILLGVVVFLFTRLRSAELSMSSKGGP